MDLAQALMEQVGKGRTIIISPGGPIAGSPAGLEFVLIKVMKSSNESVGLEVQTQDDNGRQIEDKDWINYIDLCSDELATRFESYSRPSKQI